MAIKFGRPLRSDGCVSLRWRPSREAKVRPPSSSILRARGRGPNSAIRMGPPDVCGGKQWLTADDLIWPLFVVDGERQGRVPVFASMPGVERISIDEAVARCRKGGEGCGFLASRLFSLYRPKALRDHNGTESAQSGQSGVRAIRGHQGRRVTGGSGLLCEPWALDSLYRSRATTGSLYDGRRSSMTRPSRCLVKQALVEAEAGLRHHSRPSDMMDGRVGGDPPRARLCRPH